MIKSKKILTKLLLFFLLIFVILASLLTFKVYRETKNVLSWKNRVNEVAKEYDIEQYTNLILAIIYTESKGKQVDLMQSSESKYGTTDKIFTSEESIETGVKHLSQVIKEAEAAGCDIWTAVQAYNYGTQYIDYIAEHGNVNSLDLAKVYSRDVLSPILGNTSGEMYRYYYPIALLYNGGKLYTNGGNMFYAPTVKLNLKLINFFETS